jgi:hypothetical protein
MSVNTSDGGLTGYHPFVSTCQHHLVSPCPSFHVYFHDILDARLGQMEPQPVILTSGIALNRRSYIARLSHGHIPAPRPTDAVQYVLGPTAPNMTILFCLSPAPSQLASLDLFCQYSQASLFLCNSTSSGNSTAAATSSLPTRLPFSGAPTPNPHLILITIIGDFWFVRLPA